MESGDKLTMSSRERSRLVELERVARGELSLTAASIRLGVSYRQAKRLWRRLQDQGAAGLVHRGRGRPSGRRKSTELRDRCLALYCERLEGFGPTLAAEKLLEWGVVVDHETLRRWLVAAGLWQSRARRLRHRRRRARKQRFGELVQLDGSHHDWFGSGQRCCLMSMIDDATGTRSSLLAEEETTEAALRVLWRWIERYGIPLALYTDRKTVYVTEREPTLEEQLAGESPLTVFGTACRKLGIEIIAASSPQAKGRVERSHAVYQDRLVKEIRLHGVSTVPAVNELLHAGGFDEGLNERFAVAAMDPVDVHRPLVGVQLGHVLVFEQVRTVANDWTVRHQNCWYQITGPKRRLPPAKSKVVVQRRLDGTVALLYRGSELQFVRLTTPPPAPPVTAAPSAKTAPTTRPPRPESPPAEHPWRQFLYGRKARQARRGSPGPPPAATTAAGSGPSPAR